MPGKLNQRDLSLIITDNASVDSDAPSINDKFNESAMVMKRGSFGMILIDKSTKF